MSLEKIVSVDLVEVVGPFHHVQVRTATKVVENGTELSVAYHRHVISPGESFENEVALVQDICRTAHTPEVVAAYEAARAEAAAQMGAQQAEQE